MVKGCISIVRWKHSGILKVAWILSGLGSVFGEMCPGSVGGSTPNFLYLLFVRVLFASVCI